MKKIYLFKAILILFLFISCAKEKIQQESVGSVISTLSTQIQMPNVREGRLQFNSEQHLREYHKWLSNEVKNRDVTKFPSSDSLLGLIEKELRYSSARQMIIERKNANLREGETEDWLLDEIRKSMLNQDYEVTVGQFVYVYFSENQIYKIPNTDWQQILAFRSLAKGDDNFIPKDVITEETELISATKLVRKKKKSSGGGSGNTDCEYDLYYHVFTGFNCEPLKRRVDVQYNVEYIDVFGNAQETSI